jgi:hypothetical protein
MAQLPRRCADGIAQVDDDGELSGASTVLTATAPLGPGLRTPVALDFAEEWR